jgi:hypothetical protein
MNKEATDKNSTVVDFTKEGLDINNAIQMAIANKQEDNPRIAKGIIVKGTSYSLSIQAGENYYSTPQNDIGLYTEVVGEKVARKILTRLKMPQSDTDKICKLIRWHMFNSDPDQITMSAVRRMVANVGVENIWDLMNIRLCDRIGSGRPMEEPYRLRRYYAMLEEAMKDPISVKMLKINGNTMISKLEMKPGKQMGLILLALLGEVLEDTSKNNEEYLEKRALELAEIDFESLKKLAEKGELEKEEIEEEQKIEINQKFNIRN